MKHDRPHVALLIESSRGYGRGLLRGVARYARTRGPWALYFQERGMADASPSWLGEWRGDGIIARVETRALEKAIFATGLPAVDLRGKLDLSLPLIETNDRAVCRLAADHLLERGFRQFAYCGFAGANYSIRRLRYFPTMIEQAGHSCHIYPSDANGDDPYSSPQKEVEQHGILYEDQVARWIASLPKPIGIMACNDIRGQQVLNACRAIGVAVPDEVAVIGVDNDEILCELSDPPLSSVAPDTLRIGFEAAALLDRMMRGEKPPADKLFVQPKGVVTRQSTDVTAIEDRDIARAVRLIRQRACGGLTVEKVLDEIPLSRSTLDRRFREALGRSPKAEIARVRLERVKELLTETDFTLAEIARRTGFRHPEYLSATFKRELGVTPGEFRRGAPVTSRARR